MNKRLRKVIDEPAMSDRTLLLTVEDLIHTAFGSKKENRVHFKLIQTILHILARQLHMLEQDVEIKLDEITEIVHGEAGNDDSYDDESGSYSSSSAEGKDPERKVERERKRAERRDKKDRAGKEEKGDKRKQGEKQEKEERRGRRRKGEKRDGKTSSKDREDKGRSKDRDDKDKRSRERDKSSRARRGDDDEDEGGRKRRRGRERHGELGADGPGERDGERGADGRGGTGGERKDRDAQTQDHGGLGRRDFGRQTSSSSITVSEATRRSSGGRESADKTLVGGRPARVGSIQVVTASQFALLEKAVEQLEQITGPLPEPVLPDNETLRQDMATGRTSLPDTMQAVQLNARVQAAEQGLYRMAELLMQLAQSGLLPPEFAGHMGAIEEYLHAARAAGYAPADLSGPSGPGGPGGPDDPGGPDGPGGPEGRRKARSKSGASPRGARSRVGIESGAGISDGPGSIGGTGSTVSRMDAKKSITAVAVESQVKTGVTHKEMHEMLQQMKDALYREINKAIANANHAADMASSMSRSVAEKLDIAMQVNKRVDSLYQQTEDYAEQLSGFDSGIMTQMKSFQEQLVMMRNDLSGSLALLEASNNNAETAALLDLTERHDGLVVMMDNTVHQHQNLHITEHQISGELKSLIQCVEMLREQKADRDEVLDGLKDKANLSRLAGLLYEKDFAHARSEIEKRISNSYDIFIRQGNKWKEALKELTNISDHKAEFITMMELKEATLAELKAIQKLLHKLEIMLGEPKASMLMRKLAAGASCGDSLTRALVEQEDATHGAPLPLPTTPRPPTLGAEREPCFGEVNLTLPDIRDHTCHRWVGGSHTLLSNIVKEQAEYMQLQIRPTKKFEEYGSDGKLYMMEEDIQPCAECNKLSTDEPGLVLPHLLTPTGAGDQASA